MFAVVPPRELRELAFLGLFLIMTRARDLLLVFRDLSLLQGRSAIHSRVRASLEKLGEPLVAPERH